MVFCLPVPEIVAPGDYGTIQRRGSGFFPRWLRAPDARVPGAVMVSGPRFASSFVVLLTVAAVVGGCQLPPKAKEPGGGGSGGGWDAGAPEAVVDDAGRCMTPIVADPLADARTSCAFSAGQKVTETLPIAEVDREQIPIKHVVVVMKENRSFDHLFG